LTTLYSKTESAYSAQDAAEELHRRMLKIFESASKPELTPFETFMENLAQCSRVQRRYTQNIDCRTARLPSLAERTLWLHGRLDTLMCHRRPHHTMKVTPQTFPQMGRRCMPGVRSRKRSHSVGFLRPKVLLYGERSPDESEISDVFKDDLQQPIDATTIPMSSMVTMASLALCLGCRDSMAKHVRHMRLALCLEAPFA
jgi:NAD-dependent SIR2 family protein deacetylase